MITAVPLLGFEVGPNLRRVMLTAHVVSSVGWIGTLAAFLALAVWVMVESDLQAVRGAVMAMRVITWFVIVPASLLAVVTGLVQSLGTAWGLMRHYWVLFKLVLTVLAAGILLLYTQTLSRYADLASQPGTGLAQLQAPTFLVHSVGGLILLVVATVLAVYKPRGTTRYGQRKQGLRRTDPARVA